MIFKIKDLLNNKKLKSYINLYLIKMWNSIYKIIYIITKETIYW
jgi:hypothetical protein